MLEIGYVFTNGHSTKNAFDMFPGTDRVFDVLPIHSCYVETIVLLSRKLLDSHINVKVEFGDGKGKAPLDVIAE